MIITGNKIRSIYPQNDFNWQKNCSPINADGYYDFYFSGQGANELVFKLKNNKIYSKNNYLLGGFNLNDNITFSGNVSNTTLDLYKDNVPLYLGLNRNQTGNLLGFFIESEDFNLNIDSLSIYGEQPDYYFDSNLIYNSGDQIPINLRNSGKYPIVIYSGEIVSNNFTVSGVNNFIISGNSSADFYIINNGTFSNGLETIKINLYSNLGTEILYINLSGTLIENNLFYITISPPVNTIFNGENFIYDLSLGNASGSNIEISLEYVSGITGSYYRNVQQTGFLKQRVVSGIVSGQGTIVNTLTGLVSGFNSLIGNFEYGTGSGLLSGFKIAENQLVSGYYESLGTGVGNVDFITNIAASGYKDNVIYSGFINYQGGFLTGSTILTGTGYILAQEKTGLISGIGSIFQPWTGKIYASFNSNEYENVLLQSSLRYVTGTFSTDLTNILGFGYATGRRITGFLQGDFGANNFEPGLYKFEKPFAGAATGLTLEPTGLDPITAVLSTSTTTGFVSNTLFYNVVAQGCKIDLNFDLTGTGIPASIRKINNTGVVFPVKIFNTIPINSGIEFPNENLNFQRQSGNVVLYTNYPTGGRTRISRPGPTLSGTGFFSNVFQLPFFTGTAGFSKDFYGWKESIASQTSLKTISGASVSVAYVSGLVNLFGETDSSIIDFTLTGSTGTLFNNVQFYFDTKETGNYIIANFYKTNVAGDQFLFARSGGATAYSNGSLLGNKFLVVNNVLPGTGNYKIIMSYKNFVPEIRSAGVEFSDLEYSGCEKDRAFVIKIKKVGNDSYFRSSGTITAKFLGPNYPVLNDGILQSGIIWDWSLDTFEYEKTYGFNIYPNNRYQTSFNGEMSLEIKGDLIQGSPFIELLKLDNSSKATFVIADDDKEECCGGTCVATIDGKNDFFLPKNNSELGQDFKKVEINGIPDGTFVGSRGGGSGGSGGSGADGDPDPPDGDPGGSSGSGSSVGNNPPPSSLGSVSTSSAGDASCCETDLGAKVNIGKLICYKTQYGLMVSLCNSAKCETTRGLKHTIVSSLGTKDLGNGSFDNKCASSPLEFKFSTPLGSTHNFTGTVTGRVWACGDGEDGSIRRETITSQDTATWTNDTKCECCKNYNYEEEGGECPEGQTLKAVGQYQCPEGQRTCYKCEEASGTGGPATFMAMDELLSILDLLDDI